MAPTIEQLEAETREFREALDGLAATLGRVIVGQRAVVDHVLDTLVAGGHALLEGAPGLGKTLLVRTLAQALDLHFARIQFTPDLMPADLTGTNVVVEEEGGRRFRFQKGPVFANILLADEINRATPKTQSALLEAMQEGSVTAAGKRHELPQPFFVLATQNPIEMEGTYPLPEAQLDRFMVKVLVPYPSREELLEVLERTCGLEQPLVSPSLDGPALLRYRALSLEVIAAPEVVDHAASLVLATHPANPGAPELVRRYVRYGASPRGAQALLLVAKVRALRQGRCQLDFSDLDACAPPVLRHRLILNFEGEAEGITTDQVVGQVVAAVAS